MRRRSSSTFVAAEDGSELALWKPEAGAVEHQYLEDARAERCMGNMHDFAPEANFYSTQQPGSVEIDVERRRRGGGRGRRDRPEVV